MSSDQILMIRHEYQQLSEFLRKHSKSDIPKLSGRLELIKNSYFYETLAQIDPETRLKHFKDTLRNGDRFVAKVTKVYERQAELALIWSEKLNITDLNIKATLLLFHKSSRNNDPEVEKLDIIFVEKIDSNSDSIKVVQCRALNKRDDSTAADEDEGLILEGKYRPCSTKTSFSRYMKEHNDLNNPSIIKLPFVSLLYRKQFQKAQLKRLDDEKAKQLEAAKVEKTRNEICDAQPIMKNMGDDHHSRRERDYSSKEYSHSKRERSYSSYSCSNKKIYNNHHDNDNNNDNNNKKISLRSKRYSSDSDSDSDSSDYRTRKRRKSSSCSKKERSGKSHKHSKSRSKKKHSKSKRSKHKSTKEHRHHSSRKHRS